MPSEKKSLDELIFQKTYTMDEYDIVRNEISLYLNSSLSYSVISQKAKDILTKYEEMK